MKLKSIFVVLAMSVSLIAPARVANTDQATRATQIMVKVRQIDLLNQILPLLLSKKQLEAILPFIEKTRAQQKKTEIMEYDYLVKFESDLDKSIKDGVEKDLTPSNELIKDGVALFQMFSMLRRTNHVEQVDAFMVLLDKTLNAGQKKAMVYALKPSMVDATLDPAKLSDEKRRRFFVEYILLDPSAYGLLVKMSQRK